MLRFLKRIIAKLHFYSSKVWVKIIMICYGSLFKQIGRDVIFNPISSVFSYPHIKLGNHIFIGGKAWFSGNITIGNYVMFGPSVTLLGGDHEYKNTEKPMFFVKDNEARSAEIVIEEDVWVGANVTILKGVVIRKGAIIAAGSLVNKDVEEFSIVGGIPAKVIAQRFTEEEKKEYLSNSNIWKENYER